MRKISFVISLVLFFSVGNAWANTQPKPTKKLTHQISRMLIKDAGSLQSEASIAEVRLMVDSFGKIQVLSIETSNENLEKYLMDKIDKSSVQRDSYELGIVYRVPVEIKA